MQQMYETITNQQVQAACQRFSNSCSSPEAARAWLDAHLNDGVGHLNERDGIDCPICHNQGLIYRRNERGELLSRECSCMVERRRVRKEKASGVPADHDSKIFETFDVQTEWQRSVKESAMKFTQEHIDGGKEWFYIGGQPGSGKTHILKSIFHVFNFEHQQKSIKYMSWREDIGTLKALLNSEGYKPFFDAFKKADLLFIDDFMKTRRKSDGTYAVPTDGDINIAFDLIKYRDENNLVTVISSEFSVDAIHNFDQSTGGRIKSHCGPYCLAIKREKGRDHRL